MQILTYYQSVDGGVNNLQICKVVDYPLRQIIKVFTSKKHLAQARAEKFIKTNK